MESTKNIVFWRKWPAVAAITVLLLALAGLTYRAVDQNQQDMDSLANTDLPLFEEIQKLRIALVASESAVYEYYLTTNENRFNMRFSQQSSAVSQSLGALTEVLGDIDELTEIGHINADLEDTAQTFRDVMSAQRIDWDEARAVLARMAPLTVEADKQSQALVEWVEQRIVQNTQGYSNRVSQTLYLVSFLVAIAMIVVVWLSKSHHSRLQALREQQRLASFPRSNPHPVLSLDLEGKVIYGNEAAKAIALDGDLYSILPEDLTEHLTASEQYSEWEYERSGRYFFISLGFLDEYGEYHAYLSDITARKKAEEDLEYLAYHDETTGLINRQQFNEFVDQYLDDGKSTILVSIMDMALLDRVVAAAGVSVAEKVARVAAIRLQRAATYESFFEQSCLSYVGGGLFCFAYPNDKAEADLVFHRMQEAIARPLDVDGFEFFLSLSIGVVSGDHLKNISSDEALRLADGALQQSKTEGGARIVYYESRIEEQHTYRLAIEHGLRHAIEREELAVYYQPKISLKSEKIDGVEALIRWNHPEMGFVSPADFIPIAEESGQILEIGQWVIDQVCEDIEEWNVGSKDPIGVAINISAKQLLYSDIGASVLTATKRHDIPLSWIELEITETAALTDFERALERLNMLDKLGIKLSLDDFGTGFSSLSYLQQLPVSVLKIDRSFVTPLGTKCKEETLTQSMVNMAQRLDLKVVAEGVETEEQLLMLKLWGCDFAQGYFFAKPLPLTEFLHFRDEFNQNKALNDVATG